MHTQIDCVSIEVSKGVFTVSINTGKYSFEVETDKTIFTDKQTVKNCEAYRHWMRYIPDIMAQFLHDNHGISYAELEQLRLNCWQPHNHWRLHWLNALYEKCKQVKQFVG